ncbi:MAG TPA: hypothetical protein VFV47_05320, partial [Hyphomicrobiaceae bacterium]|nr:hypothetical protein [Hyphomicrobiaceae bacterium]
MPAMIGWIIGFGVAISLLVLTAAQQQFYANMAVAALVSGLIAWTGYRDIRQTEAHPGLGASTGFRYIAAVWGWGALALLVLYQSVLQWREWWQFLLVFLVLAGVSMFAAGTLRKDAAEKRDDSAAIGLARGLAIFFFAATMITMIGLILDGKMWRFKTAAGLRVGWQDWGANNVFFFGAMAIAALSWKTASLLRRAKA